MSAADRESVELQVIARYTIAPGNTAEFFSLLPQVVAATRNEPGNRGYDVYRQLDDEHNIVLLERYASQQALDAHRETAHFRDLVLARVIPLLESRTVEIFEVG